MDVSPSALDASAKRLKMHGKTVELFQIDENSNVLQIESNSVDLIHSSGVLHHCKNLQAVVKELHRILKTGGEMQIMVYNYNSIWLHLYTAYIIQIEQGKYKGDNIFEAFRKTTDGAFCPIAWCYTPEQFISIVEKFGFKGEFTGASTSMTEMRLLPRRFDAIENKIFPAEHREFLSELSFDKNGVPLYKGQVAGINACFRFKKV
jgi:ubiquinone/menaquinone biosynthesis C-methylase UbiE